MRPGKNGGLLRTGNPGCAGGSGRPSDAFYERAHQLANDPTVWDIQSARAKSGDLKPLAFAAEYLYSRPPQGVAHSGEVTVRVEYDDD